MSDVEQVPPSGSEPLTETAAGHDRARTTRRWTVGVLVFATLALAAYLALVLVTVWVVGSAIDAISTRELGSLDVVGDLVKVIPGLLAGWFAGLAASPVLGRGEALGARGAGVAAGTFGVIVGAVVLAATDVL